MQERVEHPVNWTFPSPRSGFRGAIDRFIGPGATRAELWLQFAPAFVAALLAPAYALLMGHEWSLLLIMLSAVLAIDLVGGVITNATSAAKRWYHRAGEGTREHLQFAALHVVHVLLVAWLFRDADWTYFAVISSFLLIAVWLILSVPLYLQRPVAFALFGAGLLIGTYGFTATPGLEWFLPFFFMKVLVSHLVQEEPYRPVSELEVEPAAV